MNWRWVTAIAFSTAWLAGCQSSPTKGAWLMDGNQPWVGADGKCMQLRPLQDDEKNGFCYDVMTQAYQKQHHYEILPQDEFTFLYPHVEPTPTAVYQLEPPTLELAAILPSPLPSLLPHAAQLYTSLPFRFNNAHLSSKNRAALRESFLDWRSQGLRVVSVTVTGHTDQKGSTAYNYQLSRWRAASVAYFLAHLGIPKNEIVQGGVAMYRPNPKAHSDADNRFVDLQVWLLPPEGG